jgi:3-dehydroquinate dehydratase II
MSRVLVLNGPNLGRLGVREPEVYGTGTLAELESAVQAWGSELGLTIEARQSDSESELVGWLHEAADTRAHVALNAAALTHYSYALRDAAAEVTDAGLVLVEVHITNPAAREQFRHTSVLGGVTTGTIAGFGFDSYRLALVAIAHRCASSSEQGA